jgi:hypothetical protein
MAQCEVCGNDYHLSFEVIAAGKRQSAARRRQPPTNLQGDGWSASLNPGWVVRPAARPGSFAIVREN